MKNIFNRKFGKNLARKTAWLLLFVILINYVGAFIAPKKARAADPNMMLFWDGGAAPGGWSFVDDNAGEAFYNDTNPGNPVYPVLPRGESSYSHLAGGSITHTHSATPTSPSGGQSGGTSSKTGTVAGTSSLPSHTHAVSGSASLTTATNYPAFRNLRVIQSSGIPTTIPSGAIAIFDAGSMPNADWDSYSATQGTNYVAGYSSSGGTGGSNSHDGAGHTVSGLTLSTETQKSTPSGSSSGIVLNHTHVACSTGNVTNAPTTEPPYVNVLLGKTNKDTSVPSGMVAMFDGSSFPGDWEILSASGGPFYQKFLKSAASYSAGAGSEPTHTHTAVSCASDGKSGTGAYGTGSNNYGLRGTHSHTTTVTIDAATGSTLPPYTNVVFARKSYLYFSLTANNAPNPGDTITVDSQVDNNSASAISGSHIKYIIFIDANANSLPTAGETYITANCAGSGSWTDETNFTWEATGINVAAGGNATDSQSCANTNFPSSTTYTIWGKWHNTGDTTTYDTKTVTFTSVPTLTEILFMALVGCSIFLAVKSGVIKIKKDDLDPKDNADPPVGQGLSNYQDRSSIATMQSSQGSNTIRSIDNSNGKNII